MNNVWLVILLIIFSFPSNGQKLMNKIDSVSYSLGIMMGENLRQQGIEDINLNVFMRAFEASSKDSSLILNRGEAMSCLNAYILEIKSGKNKGLIAEQSLYLEENSKKEGVIELPSGLQYRVYEKGPDSLSSPLVTDKVLVHYEGKLIDGTIFDSSMERGEPITLPVNGVIQGWQEALQLMRPGDKWEIYIPYALGYGEKGAGGVIPAYATLIFKLELLSIEN